MPALERFVTVSSTTYPTTPQVEIPFPPDTISLIHPGGDDLPNVGVAFGPERVDDQSLIQGTASQAVSVAINARKVYLRLLTGGDPVTVQVNAVKEK